MISSQTGTMDDPASNHQHVWKLLIAYDGTGFHGWQVQPGLRTVQGELAAAIRRITGEQVLPQGSGRTDAGVHALGQVASCSLAAPIPPESFHRALNRALPPDIRILSVEHAPPSFHARHSALHKTYEYRIFRGEICPPFLARQVYSLNWPLDVEAMQTAATAVLGEHDFSSFAASDPDVSQRAAAAEPADRVRTLFESAWKLCPAEGAAGDLLLYRVRGSGFLHHMVRNLVGTFLGVGRGHTPASTIPGILAARDRSAAGATAPARGLFLVSVHYGD
jgi:tRNA pseudouridine38-40 synthase